MKQHQAPNADNGGEAKSSSSDLFMIVNDPRANLSISSRWRNRTPGHGLTVSEGGAESVKGRYQLTNSDQSPLVQNPTTHRFDVCPPLVTRPPRMSSSLSSTIHVTARSIHGVASQKVPVWSSTPSKIDNTKVDLDLVLN
jgi:hypothetical protein